MKGKKWLDSVKTIIQNQCIIYSNEHNAVPFVKGRKTSQMRDVGPVFHRPATVKKAKTNAVKGSVLQSLMFAT